MNQPAPLTDAAKNAIAWWFSPAVENLTVGEARQLCAEIFGGAVDEELRRWCSEYVSHSPAETLSRSTIRAGVPQTQYENLKPSGLDSQGETRNQ